MYHLFFISCLFALFLLFLSPFLCQVLQYHCSEMHSFLLGSRLCTIPNASSYIATLMKTACYYTSSSEVSKNSDSRRQKESSRAMREVAASTERGDSGILAKRQSTIRPVSLPLQVRVSASPLRRSFTMGASPSFCPLFVFNNLKDGESDNSGYDGDLEGGMEVLGDDDGEEERVAGVGGSLLSPLAIVPVPADIKKPLWFETPIWQCLELITECLEDDGNASQW